MPISFRVFHDLKTVQFIFKGDVDTDQQIEAYRSYRAHPGFRPHYNVFVDESRCAMPDASFSEARRLLAHLRTLLSDRAPSSRTACYCPNEAVFGCERMYASVVDYEIGRETLVTRSKSEALDYLGIAMSDAEKHCA